MRKKTKNQKKATQFFVLLIIVVFALVVLSQNVPEHAKISEEEGRKCKSVNDMYEYQPGEALCDTDFAQCTRHGQKYHLKGNKTPEQ